MICAIIKYGTPCWRPLAIKKLRTFNLWKRLHLSKVCRLKVRSSYSMDARCREGERFAAIILAAGASARMGRAKALCRLAGETFMSRALAAIDLPCISRRVVVLGHQARRIAPLVDPGDVVFNRRWRSGRTGSIKAGLSAVGSDFDAVLIHQVDFPLVDAALVQTLIDACSAHASFYIPTYHERRGHPLVIRSWLLPQIQALADDEPLRALLASHRREGLLVPVDRPSVLWNVNHPEDLSRAEAMLSG